MDVVVIYNGLGNQMSQYAFYLQKRINSNDVCYLLDCKVHNGLELNNVFSTGLKYNLKQRLLKIPYKLLHLKRYPFISTPLKILLNICGFKLIQENYNYNFDIDKIKVRSGVNYYVGGWHCELFFKDVHDEIKNIYKFSNILDSKTLFHLNAIKESNSISVHIRRGDYLNTENYELFGKVCTKEYFQNAVSYLIKHVEMPRFFIFSNDMNWVKSNLMFPSDTQYIDYNLRENSWKDMLLMANCKHNIISNSTFSWWPAWLNLNSEKLVVAPDRFLNNDISTDVYPDSWIKIPTSK